MGQEGIHITRASSPPGQTDGHTPRRMWGQLEVTQGAVFRLGGWLEAPRDKLCALAPVRTCAYPRHLASRQPALRAVSSATQSARGAHRCPAGPGLQPHRACLLTLEPLPKPPEHQGQLLPWRGSGWEQAPHCRPTGVPGMGVAIRAQRPTPPCPGEGVEQGPRHPALPSLSGLHPSTGPKNISAQGCRALAHSCDLSRRLSLSKAQTAPKEQASASTLGNSERWRGVTEPPVTRRPRRP